MSGLLFAVVAGLTVMVPGWGPAVPAGVVEIARLQAKEGFVYLKP